MVNLPPIQWPQLPRLLRHLEALAAPVVQVWGPPGSGRGVLLAALAAQAGAVALAAADLATPERRLRALERALGPRGARARWLVAPALASGLASAAFEQLVGELPAGVRLTVACAEPLPLGTAPGALLPFRELALTAQECAAVWLELTGYSLRGDELVDLHGATEGWLRPLVLAALAALASPGGPPRSAAALVAVPAVADFLRREVIGPLPEGARRALLRGDGSDRPLAARALVHPDGSRLLAPLTAVLTHSLEGSATPRVRLSLLGSPVARACGDHGRWAELEWPLRRAFRALAFLAVSPDRACSREALAEVLFPGAEGAVLARNFHPTLSHLRRAFTAVGVSTPLLEADGRYRLNPAVGWWVDCEEVTRAIDEGRRLLADEPELALELWLSAWRLYGGPFLDGAEEAWITPRREALHQQHLSLLEDLGALYVRLGRPREALDAYRAVLSEDPLSERVHVAVMELYAALGRRDLLRRQYERLTGLLREELGDEPLRETTETFHRLMVSRA